MNNFKVGIKDVIKELDINKDKVEFMNDLNLFLNVIAFDEFPGEYYEAVKAKFDEYMGRWNLDINQSFPIVSRYVKAHKLPYKIAKDEGFSQIKSDKFIISMLVELYAIKLIINNEECSRIKISEFVYEQLIKNKLVVTQRDIVLADLEYLFKDKKLFSICKSSLEKRKSEIELAIQKTINAVEIRSNIKLDLNYDMNYNNIVRENIYNAEENDISEKMIASLKKDIELKDVLINEYIDREFILQGEIDKLQKDNIELVHYGQQQYEKALVDLVKNMNDTTNGNILDRLYRYSKGRDEKNLMFVATNLFNVLRQMGISPRETTKIDEIVSIEEYSFYNYRLNKDISDIKLSEGEVIYPSWFYNSKEILKPYVKIKGE